MKQNLGHILWDVLYLRNENWLWGHIGLYSPHPTDEVYSADSAAVGLSLHSWGSLWGITAEMKWMDMGRVKSTGVFLIQSCQTYPREYFVPDFPFANKILHSNSNGFFTLSLTLKSQNNFAHVKTEHTTSRVQNFVAMTLPQFYEHKRDLNWTGITHS